MQIAIGALLAFPTFGLHVEFDPELFLVLFIPPLLFADGWKTPRVNSLNMAGRSSVLRWPGGGYCRRDWFLIYWLVPGIPLIPAFALAAVSHPPMR
jgi:CPA1 family monovalent cation:H+ antiporter